MLLSKAEIEGMMKRATKGSLDDHDKFHVFMDLAATCLYLYEKVEALETRLGNLNGWDGKEFKQTCPTDGSCEACE